MEGSNNLSREEALGRAEIQCGVKDKGWKLYGTDKSGKLVLDTRQNFETCMAPHYQDEPVVAYEAVTRSEAILNNHSKAPAKLLRLGADAGEGMLQRIQNALHVHNSNVPGLQGLRKDHKVALPYTGARLSIWMQ